VARQLIQGLMMGHRERRIAAKIGNMRKKLAMQSKYFLFPNADTLKSRGVYGAICPR
jgi:hypothetical protein